MATTTEPKFEEPFSDPSAGWLTAGDYSDEAASVRTFDYLVEQSGCFKIYREVWGELLQPRLNAEAKRVRIDRILSPRSNLIQAGWEYGPIGIECKRSGIKLGPPLSQLLDYSRAVWRMPHGYNCVFEYAFLWPVDKQHGPLASIMAQNKIGGVWSPHQWTPLKFCLGETVLLAFNREWNPQISSIKVGNKTGSR